MTKESKSAKLSSKAAAAIEGIRNRYNVNVIARNKISAALKDLGENAEEENEFRKRCGIAQPQLSAQRKHFSEYVIMYRDHGRERYLWAGSPDFALLTREAMTAE